MINLFSIRPKGFNVGNDAIFIGMQHFIYKAFGEIVNIITIPATSRYESQAKAGLTAKTIYEINQYGHGVIVGGGNLYENGELEVDLNALKALEVPMMLFSLSRGRVYNRRHKLVSRTDAIPDQILLALQRKAYCSLARDRATHAYIQQIGFDGCKVGGCPTIFLDKMIDRLPKISSQYKNSVFISIRNPSLMSIPLEKQSQMRTDVIEMINFLREEGFQDIRFLCHDHRDVSFAASFQGIDYVYTGDVYSYLALLRSCALNVSYRLHSVLPCLSFGTPTIKISYDERALSLMDTIGFGKWNINMIHSQDTVAEVRDRFYNLDELKALRKESRSIWDSIYQCISDNFSDFADAVTSYRDQKTVIGEEY